MNVSLPSELENFIHEKVKSKMYQTASEVVREALRLLKQRDDVETAKLDALRKDIQLGIDAANRGEVRLVTDKKAFLEEIKTKARRNLESRKARR